MCGFTGYYDPKFEHDEDIIKKMTSVLNNRGPDSFGLYIDRNIGISLGHTRLSIQDLSDTGSQPMHSANKRFTIVFNGEIYNHLGIRKKINENIKNINWKGTSDTETLLAAIQHFGIEESLKLLNGMFSFAVLDSWHKKLYLCRDRYGEKPLYYGINNGIFFFGSQPKSFKAHPRWGCDICKKGLNEYFVRGFISGQFSIYKDIYKLMPSHYIQIDLNNIDLLNYQSYWKRDQLSYEYYNEDFLIDELDKKIENVIKARTLSDRKIGSFLSGGIDSSLITYYLQQQFSKPIDTFTIGFDDISYDESVSARKISSFLGTNHNEVIFNNDQLLDLVNKLPSIWDEPFSDPSQLPTFLLSQMTTEKVKVAFSGDGGDELFCGYTRYNEGYNLYKFFNRSPNFLKTNFKKTLNLLKSDYLINCLGLLPENIRPNSILDRTQKLEMLLDSNDKNDFYSELTSIFNPDNLLLINEPLEFRNIYSISSKNIDYREYMMERDIMEYLPENILTKIDRASMFNGLEVRVPFLDHQFASWAQNIPNNLKRYDGKGKWPLRKLLSLKMPESLFKKPKKGFGIPLNKIIDQYLKDIILEKFSKDRIINQGILNYDYIEQILYRNFSCGEKLHNQIWNLLIFQLWFDENF